MRGITTPPLHPEHTHDNCVLGSPWAHTDSNTFTTQHATKPSSCYSPQPRNCQKDAQAAVQIVLTSGTHDHSWEPQELRGDPVMMRLLKKPQAAIQLPALTFPHSSFSLKTINLFGEGSDKPRYQK